MSTYRYRYVGGPLKLHYHAVAAAEYIAAGVKAAFQMAAAPADDPVKKLYNTFHDARKVIDDIREKYRGQFPDWQQEDADEYGDDGAWRAQLDCLNFLEDKLQEAGIMVRIDDENADLLEYLGQHLALRRFTDVATSEFRFRHAVDYNASDSDSSLRKRLEEIAPAVLALLPKLAEVDVESLRSSKIAHIPKTNSGTTEPRPSQP